MFDLVSLSSSHVGSNESTRINEFNEQETTNTLQREIEIREEKYNSLSDKASGIAYTRHLDTPLIRDFFDKVKQEAQSVKRVREQFFYHPQKEVVELFAKLYELYSQNLRTLNDRYAKPCQEVQNLLNKLMNSLSSKKQLDPEDRALIAQLQGTKLELPVSHPGMGINADNGFTIEFPETEDVETLRSAASTFYGQCDSAMQRLFITIQKLFNDQVNMFELAKDGLKNNLNQRIVQKTGEQR